MSTDGYKKGAKVYSVTAIKKRGGITITVGHISDDVDHTTADKQNIYVKYPPHYNPQVLQEWYGRHSLTDMSKCPWKLTPDEAVRFALEAKANSIKKYKKAVTSVEQHIEILRTGERKLLVQTE